MRILLTLLVVAVLSGFAYAADSGVSCTSDWECSEAAPGYPYCHGADGQATDKSLTCQSTLGAKGTSCTVDGDDCAANLVCAELGTNDGNYAPARCSECVIGEQSSGGVPSSILTESNSACAGASTPCVCRVMQTSTTWYSYARWATTGAECTACTILPYPNQDLECLQLDSAKECWQVAGGTRSVCFNESSPSHECCVDSDCPAGDYCSNRNCFVGSTTTTTTTSTTGSTTTTLVNPDSICSKDSECPSVYTFCVTGYNAFNYCTPKSDTYLGNPDNAVCHRNHECLSGRCSAHNANNASGDYPTYVAGVSDPYNGVTGTCLPSYYGMSVKTIPSRLTIGGQFNVIARNYNANNETVAGGACFAYFAPISSGPYVNVSDNYVNDTAWAYTPYTNKFWQRYTLQYDPTAPLWNYVGIAAATVNSTVAEGQYHIAVDCIDDAGNYGSGGSNIHVYLANHTDLAFGAIPPNVQKTMQTQLYVEYDNINGSGLRSATCLLQTDGANRTMTYVSGGRYQWQGSFANVGPQVLKAWCAQAGYESGFASAPVSVLDSSCFNGYKDATEEGVDCGGNCVPCNQTSCESVGGDCTTDADCCSNAAWVGACVGYKCRQATCSDGIQDQGETGVDVGGPCPMANYPCLQDNDCSSDGSYRCVGGLCTLLNCTVDSECPTLQWCTGSDCVIEQNGAYVPKPTYCDTNAGVCRFNARNTVNGTTNAFGMDFTPSTGLAANVSGTILYVLNCEVGNYGFTVHTNRPTKTFYSFNYTGLTPSLGISLAYRPFADGVLAQDKSGPIAELCEAVNGYGGIPTSSHSVFARLNFQSCSGTVCVQQYADALVYRRSLKSDLMLGLNNGSVGTTYYLANATNRTLYVMIASSAGGQYVNVSNTYLKNTVFNLSQVMSGQNKGFMSVYYYRINTSYGEVVEGRNGDVFWWFLEWDNDKQWFKLNFELHSWMIWILLAAGLVVLAYANYRV